MDIQSVILPVFLQVLLTFGLLFWMGNARIRSVRQRQVKVGDIALGQQAWPERPTQIANAYHNQFQIPVLFYVLVILAWITRKADLLFVIGAWLFVASRFVHAYVHTTSNYIPYRFNAFLAGVIVLLIMWMVTVVRIMAGI